ncbi:hypothetical protein [Flavobacterium sp. ZB4P13]|uniref:hypothetical protein n=1 Tax=Flavobacterium sp. ZB4P13 TaxID=3401728 RepID=UPI003AB0A69C
MRNIFLLLLFVLSNCYSQSQSNYVGFENVVHNSAITTLQGKWRINHLIINSKIKEYGLSPQNPDRFENYGNNISLNTDQTFLSGYSAECGNDCFTTSKGKYKIIDENYICFYLEEITHRGDCSGNSQPNKDLGLFYYYKNNNDFNLIKSYGTFERDKENIEYGDLIVAKYKDLNNSDYTSNSYLLSWKQTNLNDENDIVAFCMAENQIKDYEFLYSKITDEYSSSFVALVKINGEFHNILYDGNNKQVSLYDDSQINKIAKLVNEIDMIKSLKSISFKETYDPKTSSSNKNTITVYKKKKEIYKISQVKYFQNSESTYSTTIYFQNLKPFYIEYQRVDINNKISKMGFYVLDWEKSKVVNKSITQEAGQIDTSIYREKQNINKILDEVKKQNL